jgi:hypothetical protein
MARNVQQVYEGEWVTWKKKDRLQCCDCLLIHDLEFRVRDKRLEIKMYRNNRSTAAYRRGAGIKLATIKK